MWLLAFAAAGFHDPASLSSAGPAPEMREELTT
jgi:hypothetical protein